MNKQREMTVSYNLHEFALLAVFTAIWAVVEIGVGFSLQAAKIPFTGSFLAAVGVIVLIIGKSYVPRPGSVLLMGVTLAFLKLVYLGGAALFPSFAILTEATLTELALHRSKPTYFRCMWAGGLTLVWPLAHPFITQGLISGWGIIRVFKILAERSIHLFGVKNVVFAMIAVILLHIGFGMGTGWFSMKLVKILRARTVRTISAQVDLVKY